VTGERQKPDELAEAEFVDQICQRYGVLPSAVIAEGPYLYRMMAILGIAAGADSESGETVDGFNPASIPMETF
tara:strand:- start:1392 stop:1610 length:219 start_codon:yes stop_codon:yes gene_type:complete